MKTNKTATPKSSLLLDRVLAKAKEIDRAFGDDVDVKHAIIQGVKQGPAFDALMNAAQSYLDVIHGDNSTEAIALRAALKLAREASR